MMLFTRYLFRSFLLFCALSSLTYAQVSELSATVDKNPVLADESITLSVVASGDTSRDAFDPTALNADFIVGRTSVSSQTQMINFDTTRTTVWTTTLIPRKPGRFIIPAFTVEGKSSVPINMMVLPVSARQGTEGRDVYVTTSVDTKETYLQQQIRYTVKLFLARDLQRGSLSAPTLIDGEIRQIGKDAEYNDIVDGKRYRIIERTFAVIPQKSGTFTIQGPVFEGEVVQDRQQSFGFFNRSKAISRVGPPQEVTVKPIPQNYSGTWLPSDYVELHEEWQPDAKQFKVGEPITRTLTLTAVGVDEAQLPNINSQYPDSVKVYPNQANTTTIEKDKTLIAQRTETIAIIPSQAGEITFAEVKVPWFNIVSGQVEYATLAKRTVTIMPSLGDSITPNPPPTQTSEQATNPSTPLAITEPNATATVQVASGTQWWSWSSWVLLFLWIVTVIGWVVHVNLSSRSVRQSSPVTGAALPEIKAWKALQSSVGTQDCNMIMSALTVWLNALTGQTGQALPQLQRRLQNEQLNHEINQLYAVKFRVGDNQWQNDNFMTVMTLIRQQKKASQKSNEKLAPLYQS
ncbi:BatD family protein [Paraglaciecola polaris]|uniref:BatD protein n=1 Tax=Paraglaciecola polaris LMG 21857 TaxID=1129793 RepID=K6ZM80_9ALTE|nr:BatD family protein [Paraglaciecola polaris]GAC31412.1 BatD protein [Paraglaciecola polaris LMG 21857]